LGADMWTTPQLVAHKLVAIATADAWQ